MNELTLISAIKRALQFDLEVSVRLASGEAIHQVIVTVHDRSIKGEIGNYAQMLPDNPEHINEEKISGCIHFILDQVIGKRPVEETTKKTKKK